MSTVEGPAAEAGPERRSGLTVLIPAWNEAASVADTIRSIQAQTLPPEEIIVVDDCSSDNTGDIARGCGVTVLRPPKNSGSKAGALNFALPHVNTEFTMAIDADTTLAPDAIEKLLAPLMEDPEVTAACGFVIPRHVNTVWERGRYLEYLFAFTFYKPIQDFYDKPLIASGCFSVHRTTALKALNGWSQRTVAEDMDLTWRMYLAGHRIRYVPEAVCYPIEPRTFALMSKQLRRWSHGFVQCTKLHWKGIFKFGFLRSLVSIGLWDAAIASIAFLFVVPLLAIFHTPFWLLAYLVDLGAITVPILYKAARRKEVLRALASFPGFFVLRFVNSWFVLAAIWQELVMRRPLKVFEKGH
jgi:cellulose synthase/poly-beta-1,6-N-acetylglucosamine synthase-like glycosyltransferase